MAEQNTALPVINVNDNIDLKVQDFFAGFFSPNLKINENDYELVKSFCKAKTNNDTAAAALTVAIIQAVNELGLYASDVIKQFNETDAKISIPMFLNLTRSGTSLLGYINDKQVPHIIQQQVLT
jgi:hypothetical protein